MIKTIGKPGTCIWHSDRQEILFAIGNLLDMRTKDLEKMRNELVATRMIRPGDAYKHPAIIMFEDLVERTKGTRDRVIDTPECEQ